MSSNIANRLPFVRLTRHFPEELPLLVREVTKAWEDMATAMNNRTISVFPTAKPALSGENWFLTGARAFESKRQVFTFTSLSAINHGIDFDSVEYFTRCYGEYTDGTNWYGIISGTSSTVSGQLLFFVTPTAITFVQDGTQPALTKGIITLEWISKQ